MTETAMDANTSNWPARAGRRGAPPWRGVPTPST